MIQKERELEKYLGLIKMANGMCVWEGVIIYLYKYRIVLIFDLT